MFESDDFDDVLSQFDIPEAPLRSNSCDNKENSNTFKVQTNNSLSSVHVSKEEIAYHTESGSNNNSRSINLTVSPKYTKRKIVDAHFHHQNKRKFPGPAGLLSGNLGSDQDDNISHIELLSQDVNFTQNRITGNAFDGAIWLRLTKDINEWNLHGIDTISSIKQQEISRKLQRRKAHAVIALVETVDRSPTDPLVILRDKTGYIKCTLHRDAWSTFSTYIVPEYCAVVLWKPTILTTGSAFKKYYLNITLSNIFALYSSVNTQNDTELLPDGFLKTYDEGVTVIRIEKEPKNSFTPPPDSANEEYFIDELDNIFSDDVF